jgi:hypothetical protein
MEAEDVIELHPQKRRGADVAVLRHQQQESLENVERAV